MFFMERELRVPACSAEAQHPSFVVLEKETGTPCSPSLIAEIEKLPESYDKYSDLGIGDPC